MRTIDSQLHVLSREDYLAPTFVDVFGGVHTRPANNLPLVIWPDGSWCHSGNSFIRDLFERNLSRRNRGGSLSVAVASLSHLLRYCWVRKIDPLDLSDSQFTELIGELLAERHHTHPDRPKRGANRVIAIGRTCLQYLFSVSQYQGDNFLVGPEGRIRAQLKEFQVSVGKGGQGRTKTVRFWDHAALPSPGALGTRSPISTKKIVELRSAVYALSKSPHIRLRRHVILKLLEITGGRRGEIAEISVKSILEASRMERPMLCIPTLKTRRGCTPYRYVPISRSDVAFLLQYVEVHRRAVIRRRKAGKPDHGLLLVSEVSGEPLKATSITQEIRFLAKEAGIAEKACPHMFRHRFITKLFVALIEQHRVANPEAFRSMLLSGEELKTKVSEWTGTRPESLDAYIDLAFDEVAGFKKIFDLVTVGLTVDSFLGSLECEMQRLSIGDDPHLVACRLVDLARALKGDLLTARSNRSE